MASPSARTPTSPGAAAPDVDLQKQGLPTHYVIGIAIAAISLLVGLRYQQADGSSSSGGRRLGTSSQAGKINATDVLDEESSSFWLLWLLLWMLWRLFQLLVFLAFLLLAALVTRQRSILYVPVPPGTQRSTKDNPLHFRSPANWGLTYEDLMIPTEDGTKVNAWFVYHPIEKLGKEVPYTAVYFHGNAGNIGHRLENIRDMHEKLKLNILIVDYRAYGDSEDGNGPSEKGFMMDAIATYRWLVNRIRNPPGAEKTRLSTDKILFFGRSIGGAVATRLMASLLKEQLEGRASNGEDPLPVPVGLILENTFTSLRDMAVTIFPFLGFVGPLLRKPLVLDEWRAAESLRYIVNTTNHWCVCLLSGLDDKIVPPIQMRQLHDIIKTSVPRVKKMYVFKDGGHNDTPLQGGVQYWQKFNEFMSLVRENEEERREGRRSAGLTC